MTRFINNSPYSLDYLIQKISWFDSIMINDYQLITVLWNIFLILISLLLILYFEKLWRTTKFKKYYHKLLAVIIGAMWLLFIPNTAYIITEVRHLLNYCPLDSPDKVCLANAWLILFFFCYGTLGWISYYYLLKKAAVLIEEIFNKLMANLFIFIIIPLISLGVLLGLLNRWNSWEIFIYPLLLFNTARVYFANQQYFLNWLIFTAFLYILYFAGSLIFKTRINGLFKNR